MYSLSKATELLIDHYQKWTKWGSEEIITYNTHKIRHSNGVLEVWRNLLIKIKENITISKELENKCEVVFLLHDVWRFYQNDKKIILSNDEFEHWEKGYEILKDHYDESICLAVKYHNKYDIKWLYEEENYKKMTEKEKKETEFFTKIVRDADKLQNMIYTIFNFNIFLKLANKEKNFWDISDETLKNFLNKKSIDKRNIKTKADYIISMIWWIYDINFKESIDMLNYFWYKEKMINELEKIDSINKEKIKLIKNQLLE